LFAALAVALAGFGALADRGTPSLVPIPNEAVMDLSRDGHLLAFHSTRSGASQVWLKDFKTGEERRLTNGEGGVGQLCVDADGRFAYMAVDQPQGVVQMRTQDGEVTTVCRGCGLPTDVSPDGRSVLLEQRGTVAPIAVHDMVTGAQTMILDDPRYAIYRAHFSPDGQWIVFHTADAATAGAKKVLEFIAPFHGARPIPAAEWIEIADGQNDAAPGLVAGR
jgi:Tol biopolymer transport system component